MKAKTLILNLGGDLVYLDRYKDGVHRSCNGDKRGLSSIKIDATTMIVVQPSGAWLRVGTKKSDYLWISLHASSPALPNYFDEPAINIDITDTHFVADTHSGVEMAESDFGEGKPVLHTVRFKEAVLGNLTNKPEEIMVSFPEDAVCNLQAFCYFAAEFKDLLPVVNKELMLIPFEKK